MRKIKFRGKDAITGCWAYGYYYPSKGHHIIRDEKDCECIVLPESVGEWSGLKSDNNKGEDLYEKDVVYLAGYGNYVVEFPFIDLYDAIAEFDVEHKLGNITDNPSLLESKQ